MRFVTIPLFVLLLSCGKAPQKQAHTKSSDSLKTVVNIPDFSRNSFNQAARIIAGIYQANDSLYTPTTQNPAWQAYNKEADSMWANYPVKNANMYQWAKNEVYPRTSSIKNVFYPFSGPDFLYVNVIYPNAENIYMFGLERVGSVPGFNIIPQKQIGEVLNMYKTSINEVVTDSYYRTAKMSAYLHNLNVDGVTPVIMLFMARSGKQIKQINLVTIDYKGEITKADSTNFRKLENQGVEFIYNNCSDTIMRRLVYMKGNTMDDALKTNTAYASFLKNLHPEGSFSKSASYLMHCGNFSTVRNVILDNCKVTVQDDTGVSFHFYDPKVWDIQLYGVYTKVISEFTPMFEKDLQAAYQDPNRVIKPLNFRIGYNNPSNARISTRK